MDERLHKVLVEGEERFRGTKDECKNYMRTLVNDDFSGFPDSFTMVLTEVR